MYEALSPIQLFDLCWDLVSPKCILFQDIDIYFYFNCTHIKERYKFVLVI